MQVKKAAEKAWEADKDKESACALRQIPRKPVIGSTKRVEQFRKNLRRWMTGDCSLKVRMRSSKLYLASCTWPYKTSNTVVTCNTTFSFPHRTDVLPCRCSQYCLGPSVVGINSRIFSWLWLTWTRAFNRFLPMCFAVYLTLQWLVTTPLLDAKMSQLVSRVFALFLVYSHYFTGGRLSELLLRLQEPTHMESVLNGWSLLAWSICRQSLHLFSGTVCPMIPLALLL